MGWILGGSERRVAWEVGKGLIQVAGKLGPHEPQNYALCWPHALRGEILPVARACVMRPGMPGRRRWAPHPTKGEEALVGNEK
jgi:hypothetical protein